VAPKRKSDNMTNMVQLIKTRNKQQLEEINRKILQQQEIISHSVLKKRHSIQSLRIYCNKRAEP